MCMYTFRVVIIFGDAKYGLLDDTSIHQHNPFVVSGNVAYKQSTNMGHGNMRMKCQSPTAVDGNVDPDINHHHCAFAQNNEPLSHSWVVDLRGIYDIEKIILHASKGN